MARFLLDTGLLMGMVADESWLERRAPDAVDGEAERLTSAVCHGELLALAKKRGWGARKRERMEAVLRSIRAVPVSSRKLLDTYAALDAWSQGKAHGPGGEPGCKPSRTMGKNDLWVAATAHNAGAVLLSTDTDFQHLHKVWFDFRLVPPN